MMPLHARTPRASQAKPLQLGVLAILATLLLGISLLPRDLVSTPNTAKQVLATFYFNPKSERVHWADPKRLFGIQQGWVIRRAIPRTLIGIPMQTPRVRIDPPADFTQTQRQIILESWARKLEPSSPWHAAIPALISQGQSGGTPSTTYLIALAITTTLGLTGCLLLWRSIIKQR